MKQEGPAVPTYNLNRCRRSILQCSLGRRRTQSAGDLNDPVSNFGMIFATFDKGAICSYRRNDAMSYCRTNAFSADPCVFVLYVYASEYGHQSERWPYDNSCNAKLQHALYYRFGLVVLGWYPDLRYGVFAYTEVLYLIHKVLSCRTMEQLLLNHHAIKQFLSVTAKQKSTTRRWKQIHLSNHHFRNHRVLLLS
jgi:hypothetical protein